MLRALGKKRRFTPLFGVRERQHDETLLRDYVMNLALNKDRRAEQSAPLRKGNLTCLIVALTC